MTEAPKGSLGGALRETVSGRDEVTTVPLRADALMLYNPSRVALVQALLLEPAVSAAHLSVKAGADHSSTAWHLKRLVASEMVARLTDEGGAFYTLYGLVPDADALADLRTCYCAGCPEMLGLASRSPGLDIAEASKVLGVGRGAASRTLSRLSARRLLATRRDGPRRRIFLTNRLDELSDMSRRWYRDYRGRLLSRLRSEGLEVATDIAQDRSLLLEYKAGGQARVLTVPYKLTF